jgi:transposase
MLADELDYVIGVDPHRDAHAVAIVDAASGGARFETQIGADAGGYSLALQISNTHARGRRVWALEGSGSYGAGLAHFLVTTGERVLEVSRLRREQRSHAKTDALDALRAARSVLGTDKLAAPRAGGAREALRALMVARAGALEAKTAALCQLRALIVTCPEPLRAELVSLSRTRLLARCSRLRAGSQPALAGVRLALRSVALRTRALTDEERELKREIELLVLSLAPALLAEPGVGPVSAAQILLSWSHHGRFRSDAAFARLAAAAPIPASSGQTIRHRLGPGGDRQLNRALHTIIVSRRKNHAQTIAYCERRLREGKTVREAMRCLKRFLARRLFRILEGTPTPA